MRRIAFGLGANLGDRVAALQGAVDVIAPLLAEPAVSSVYETAPVGGPEQPDYANAVLIGLSEMAPSDVLALAQLAEQQWHRTREIRWGPRTLDVDVLDIEGVVSDDPVLTLPHPRATQRAFVVVPWLEVEPTGVLADGAALADHEELVAEAIEQGLVRRREDVGLVIAP